MTNSTTLIHSIDWLVAWDSAEGVHVYLRNADLAFSGDCIDYVGFGYTGAADRRIDGRGVMIAPGLLSLHSHPWSETLHKGYIEDFCNPALGMMAMYDMMPGWIEDEEAWRTAAGVAYCELLQSGVTTLVDISPPYDGWLEQLAASGLRGVVAPSMASAYWTLSDAHNYRYHWFEDGGDAKFTGAMKVIDAALDHPSGRLGAMVFPAQVDTCTAAFFAMARAAAAERGLPLQTHAAQSEPEYHEMIRRHGKTPIAWLDDIGMLGPDTTIGHGIFMDHHSWFGTGKGEDLKRMADRGASVAHSPTVFMRTAAGLEHFAAYRNAGINVALATDTFPNNMLEEMRLAAHLARVQSQQVNGAATADVFHAATIGGARALLREDLGRLAPGCKADFFTVRLDHPLMQPLRDPLRSLVHTAAERAVEDVYVGGDRVVCDGRAMNLDYAFNVVRLTDLSERCAARIPDHDPLGRTAEELMPPSLKTRFDEGKNDCG